jgi:hypothetical protein
MTQEEKMNIVAAMLQSGKVDIGQFVVENNGTMNYNASANNIEAKGQSYSDEQVARALERIVGKGKTVDSKQKWAGVYWYLRWACNYPVNTKQACERIMRLPFDGALEYPCDYNNIRRMATASFMNQDARQLDSVKPSRMDEPLFAQCRVVAQALAQELETVAHADI